jgi:hypothetical protein
VAAGDSDPDHHPAADLLALGSRAAAARSEFGTAAGGPLLLQRSISSIFAGMYLSDAPEAEAPAAPTGPTPTVLEAIVRQRCLSATYNRTRMVLAPHILYTRNDALYVDALVVSREGMLPREPKLGTFKLDGLNELKLTGREFEISELFEPEAEKYAGTALMMVEPGA